MKKHTYRLLSLLLAVTLTLGLLAGCTAREQPESPSPEPSVSEAGPSSVPTPELSVVDLAEQVFPYSGCRDLGNAQRLNSEEDADTLAFYIENAYKLEEGAWEDTAVIRATGASAFEVAVLRCADGDAAARTAARLEEYRQDREGDFTGYAPMEANMVHDGAVEQNGVFVGLFLCPEPGLASAAFAAALDGTDMPALPDPAAPLETPSESPSEMPLEMPSESPSETPGETPMESPGETPMESPSEVPSEPTAEILSEVPSESLAGVPSELPSPVQYPDRVPFTPPNKDDMSLYDTTAIRAAWTAGDPSWLSDYDKAIYNAAQSVLTQTLTTGMSDYEKEKAVYQWMVMNVNYDWTHNNVMTPTPRESFTPYGGLVNRTAVCLGYATSFQLLMDLAGVECITIPGAASQSRQDHGWNMVRLGGNWYCVDVTWDADWRERGQSRGQPSDWRFFNVTSDHMAATDHQWDYVGTPEAVTPGNGA